MLKRPRVIARRTQSLGLPDPDRRYHVAPSQAPIPLPTMPTPPGHNGLDQCASMLARCLLECPGTGRQDTVLMSLRLAGLRYSSACHSVPVTQVFKKVSLSSGLLIRGFGVQVPGGAHRVTWGFIGLLLCPVCPVFLAVLAPRLLGGRMLAGGRLVKNAPIGLDQPSEPPPMQLRGAITAGMDP